MGKKVHDIEAELGSDGCDRLDRLRSLLRGHDACDEATAAMEWARGMTPREAWEKCEFPKWLIWLAGKAGVDRRLLVGAAVECAKPAVPLMARKWQAVADPLLVTAVAWLRGVVTDEDVDRLSGPARTMAKEADDVPDGHGWSDPWGPKDRFGPTATRMVNHWGTWAAILAARAVSGGRGGTKHVSGSVSSAAAAMSASEASEAQLADEDDEGVDSTKYDKLFCDVVRKHVPYELFSAAAGKRGLNLSAVLQG